MSWRGSCLVCFLLWVSVTAAEVLQPHKNFVKKFCLVICCPHVVRGGMLHTVALRESPATMQRKLVKVTCICDLITLITANNS